MRRFAHEVCLAERLPSLACGRGAGVRVVAEGPQWPAAADGATPRARGAVQATRRTGNSSSMLSL
jgi:hypothetical protein